MTDSILEGIDGLDFGVQLHQDHVPAKLKEFWPIVID